MATLAARIAELERLAILRGGRTALAPYFAGAEYDGRREQIIAGLLRDRIYMFAEYDANGALIASYVITRWLGGAPLVRIYNAMDVTALLL